MRIEVNPIACTAHGLCAELLPERITLDDWGYPIIDGEPIPPALERLARKAAGSCPTLALHLRAEAALNVSTRRNGRAAPAPARGRAAKPPPPQPPGRRRRPSRS